MNIDVKDKMKQIYYSKAGKMLRRLPEGMILEKRCRECKKSLQQIENRNRMKKKKKKIRVVFLLEYPEIWNSSFSVFESLNTGDKTEAYIVALPKYPKTEPNEAYQKLAPVSENVILGFEPESDQWFDLEKFAPDYVFYSRPYAKEYPQDMRPEIVSKYAKLCYLTYGYDFTVGYHNEVSFNLKMMPYMHMIFCEGVTSGRYCRRMFKHQGRDKKILELGYPRFDLLYRLTSDKTGENRMKTFLWTPRWSLEKLANDGSSYFDFIEPLLRFFSLEENKGRNLIIRPHPLMFENFVKNHVMTAEEVEEIRRRVESMPNVCFDTETDYLKSACEADLVIADYTSLLLEYVVMDLPILYCGSSDKFDAVGRLLDKAMYHISDYGSIIEAIGERIVEGDTMKKRRSKVIGKISKDLDGKIGHRFAEAIIEDYEEVYTG